MNKDSNKYFEVTAKCGHVGRNNFIPIKFAVVADSGKDAANKVRLFPRVKHHHKDAILSVNEIDKHTFGRIIKENRQDPYLHCRSKQEQELIINLDTRMIVEQRKRPEEYDEQARFNRIAYNNKKNKIYEKLFLTNMYDCENLYRNTHYLFVV